MALEVLLASKALLALIAAKVLLLRVNEDMALEDRAALKDLATLVTRIAARLLWRLVLCTVPRPLEATYQLGVRLRHPFLPLSLPLFYGRRLWGSSCEKPFIVFIIIFTVAVVAAALFLRLFVERVDPFIALHRRIPIGNQNLSDDFDLLLFLFIGVLLQAVAVRARTSFDGSDRAEAPTAERAAVGHTGPLGNALKAETVRAPKNAFCRFHLREADPALLVRHACIIAAMLKQVAGWLRRFLVFFGVR